MASDKKPTVLKEIIDLWNRMPAHIFQTYMQDNYKSLLEKERQQLFDAHDDGVNHEHCGEIDAEIYYRKTFTNPE